jgi:hypothetical protein
MRDDPRPSAAAIDAVAAGLGSIGLAESALLVLKLLPYHGAVLVLCLPVVWFGTSLLAFTPRRTA